MFGLSSIFMEAYIAKGLMALLLELIKKFYKFFLIRISSC